jgi:hypothetical protein
MTGILAMKVIPIHRFVFALLIGIVQIAAAQMSGAAADVDKRVDSIVSRMTIEEKITYIGGINNFFIRWNADPDTFRILVGGSSDKIELQGTFVHAP